MTNRTSTITARRLLRGSELVEYPVIRLEDGHIASIHGHDSSDSASSTIDGETVHRFPDALLVPAFLNIHVHGSAGFDVMQGTPQAMHAVGASLASHGTGAYYPTTVTASIEETLRSLDLIAAAIETKTPSDCAVPLGIHLEGPFLSVAKRGAHPAAKLVAPSVSLFDRFWQAARGHIRIMTIAPELPGATELIEHATPLGVVSSMGHSNGTMDEAQAGHRAGARSATHTFNAMRTLDHRNPGICAYVLDRDALYAEIVCDGIHVDPAMIRLFFKAKGMEKSILITDGMAATGMPDGHYKLGDLDVDVQEGKCTLTGTPGVLAGSVLSMDAAIRNFSRFTGLSLAETTLLAARNPAALMHVDQQWGRLEVGREANFVALSAEGRVLKCFRNGHALAA